MTHEQMLVVSDAEARQRATPVFACSAVIKFSAGLNGIPLVDRGYALRVIYSGN
jgi:hypothetical protein